jgi:hypothetical protein
MELTTYEMSGTITNNCICYYCPECDIIHESYDWPNRCGECGNENIDQTAYCEGFCWEGMQDYLGEALKAWCEAVKNDEFAIYGSGMGWMGESGHTGRLNNLDGLLKSMSINTEWRIEWTLNSDNLYFKMRRWSHDEPTGHAIFYLKPWTEGDDE